MREREKGKEQGREGGMEYRGEKAIKWQSRVVRI